MIFDVNGKEKQQREICCFSCCNVAEGNPQALWLPCIRHCLVPAILCFDGETIEPFPGSIALVGFLPNFFICYYIIVVSSICKFGTANRVKRILCSRSIPKFRIFAITVAPGNVNCVIFRACYLRPGNNNAVPAGARGNKFCF